MPVVRRFGEVPTKLTLHALREIYTRDGVAGSPRCLGVRPLLPRYGSTTRGAWARTLGVVDYDFSGSGRTGVPGARPVSGRTWGTCVTGVVRGRNDASEGGARPGGRLPGDRLATDGRPFPPDDGRFVTGVDEVMPYSTDAWLRQGAQLTVDLRGWTTPVGVDPVTQGRAVHEPSMRYPLVTAVAGDAAAGPSAS